MNKDFYKTMGVTKGFIFAGFIWYAFVCAFLVGMNIYVWLNKDIHLGVRIVNLLILTIVSIEYFNLAKKLYNKWEMFHKFDSQIEKIKAYKR